MSWFALSLLSAFAFASADAATKRWFADVDVWDAVVVRFGLSGLLLAPALPVVWMMPADARFWLWVGALLPLDIAAIYLYARAIALAPLSHTLPYLAFTPVFTALTGWLLLGERVSPAGLVGVALVSGGAYALNLDAATWRVDKLAPLRFVLRERGPRLMLGVALIFSLTSTLGKGALAYMPPLAFGPFYGVLLGATACLVVLARRRRLGGVVVARPGGAAIVSIAMAVMMLAHFAAIAQVEAAYMIAVKRTSMLFGLVYGALLFGEHGLVRNLAAATVMVVGVAALTVLR
ncbi:MAG: DMT family transporter [Gammaproteobacteria bacterium]